MFTNRNLLVSLVVGLSLASIFPLYREWGGFRAGNLNALVVGQILLGAWIALNALQLFLLRKRAGGIKWLGIILSTLLWGWVMLHTFTSTSNTVSFSWGDYRAILTGRYNRDVLVIGIAGFTVLLSFRELICNFFHKGEETRSWGQNRVTLPHF